MGRGGERASVVVGTAKSRNREEKKTSLWGRYRFRLAFLTLPENEMIREVPTKTVFKDSRVCASSAAESCWRQGTARAAKARSHASDSPAHVKRCTDIRTAGTAYSCERLVLVPDFDRAFCSYAKNALRTGRQQNGGWVLPLLATQRCAGRAWRGVGRGRRCSSLGVVKRASRRGSGAR